MFKRLIASLVCLTFIFSNFQKSEAQDFSINQLPVPGTMVGESVPFAPLALKGLVVNPNKPLEFQFIVDTGRGPQDTASIKDQTNQLVKYFLAGLTIPEGDLWVNLSPYEKDRMVPEALGQTDLGRDLLAQDYILKQLTASLIYPEKDLGKEFWSRVYQKSQEKFGTTNIPVNTFNKVWILPNQAQVFENGNAAYVTQSTLKIMLDQDYLAKQKHQATQASSVSSQVVREIVLPEIEKEVNAGKNFAPLRQIYQALILAKWYKETIQNGLLDAVYTNKNKVAGVNLGDPAVKEQIYQRYLQAYKKGAFNYIKENSTPDGQAMPRKYFSGGAILGIPKLDRSGHTVVHSDGAELSVGVALEKTKLTRRAIITGIAATAISGIGSRSVNAQIYSPQTYSQGQTVPQSPLSAIYPLNINGQIISIQVSQDARTDGRPQVTPEQIREFLRPFNNGTMSVALDGLDEAQRLFYLHSILALNAQGSAAVRDEIERGDKRVALGVERKFFTGNVRIPGITVLVGTWPVIFGIPKVLGANGKVLNAGIEYPRIQPPFGSYDTSWRDRTPPELHQQIYREIGVGSSNRAMLTDEKGGIDLNQINVHRTGKTVNVQFDPAQLNDLMQGGFEGFTPVITNITPIQSPLPLLGIGPAKVASS